METQKDFKEGFFPTPSPSTFLRSSTIVDLFKACFERLSEHSLFPPRRLSGTIQPTSAFLHVRPDGTLQEDA